MVSCNGGSYAATVNEHSFKNFFLIFLYFFFFAFSGVDEEWRNNFREREEACTIKESKTGSESDNWFSFWTTIYHYYSIIHSSILGNILFSFSFVLFLCFCVCSMLILLFGLVERSTRRTSDRVRRSKIDLDASQLTDVHNYRYMLLFQPLIRFKFVLDH